MEYLLIFVILVASMFAAGESFKTGIVAGRCQVRCDSKRYVDTATVGDKKVCVCPDGTTKSTEP